MQSLSLILPSIMMFLRRPSNWTRMQLTILRKKYGETITIREYQNMIELLHNPNIVCHVLLGVM